MTKPQQALEEAGAQTQLSSHLRAFGAGTILTRRFFSVDVSLDGQIQQDALLFPVVLRIQISFGLSIRQFSS